MEMLQRERRRKQQDWVFVLVFVCRRLPCWAQVISGLCSLTHDQSTLSDSLAAPLIGQLDGRHHSNAIRECHSVLIWLIYIPPPTRTSGFWILFWHFYVKVWESGSHTLSPFLILWCWFALSCIWKCLRLFGMCLNARKWSQIIVCIKENPLGVSPLEEKGVLIV